MSYESRLALELSATLVFQLFDVLDEAIYVLALRAPASADAHYRMFGIHLLPE